MAIKRVGGAVAEKPQAPVVKRVQAREAGETSSFDREAALGRLLWVRLKEYSDSHPGKFGAGPRAVVDIIDLDADGEPYYYPATWLFSTLGRQIARDLEVGEIGCGHIVTGTTATGQSWYGFEFATDDADYARADKATPKF